MTITQQMIGDLPLAVLQTAALVHEILPPGAKVRPKRKTSGWDLVVASLGEHLPPETRSRIFDIVPAGVASVSFVIGEMEDIEQLQYDECRLYTTFDRAKIPDISACPDGATPGNVVLERLITPEKLGSLFIPESLQKTYYYGDDPKAGMEPSACIVLSAGVDCDDSGYPITEPDRIERGDIVLLRDGDGLIMSRAKLGDYISSSEVIVCGWMHPDDANPGEMELLPWEESILARLEGEEWVPKKRNVLIEVIEAEHKLGELFLSDRVRTRPSEAIVLAVGAMVDNVKPGDKILYHPLGEVSFYEPEFKKRRFIREMAVLAVLESLNG